MVYCTHPILLHEPHIIARTPYYCTNTILLHEPYIIARTPYYCTNIILLALCYITGISLYYSSILSVTSGLVCGLSTYMYRQAYVQAGSCVACRSCEYTYMCRRARVWCVWSIGHGCTDLYVGRLVCGLHICKPRHISNTCGGGLVFSLSVMCV